MTIGTAQKTIARYLDRSATDASLHPDATLAATYYGSGGDDAGVRFPQTGPHGGLVLHYLRRIEAGLRGENLAAQSREELKTLFNDESSGQAHLEAVGRVKKGKRERSFERVNEWSDAIDADQFAREQDAVDDEIGESLGGTGEQGQEPRVNMTMKDKLQRKAAKKARRKEKLKQAKER